MSKILPMPFHTVSLLAVWLMLNNSISPGHILLGTVLGIAIPWLCQPLRIPQPKFKKPYKLFSYTLMVLKDVVTANIEVALLVLGPSSRIKPGFVAVPLDLSEALPITMLASTVTMTPGTVSAELSNDGRFMYVHVLNMPEDEEEIVNFIKSRYEAKIKEIFEC